MGLRSTGGNPTEARMWRVRRHSGRDDGIWRDVLTTPDEDRARAKYARLHEAMRQGGVELLSPAGERVAYVWAPRLRTRW